MNYINKIYFYFLQGVLRIHVVEAKHLMKKDIGVLGKGKSDPYAIVTVGAQEFRTQIIDNTVDPKWDYWCEVSEQIFSYAMYYIFNLEKGFIFCVLTIV